MPRLASLLPALPLLLSLSSSVLASPAPHHLSLGRRHHSKRAVSDVDERNLELRSGDEKHQLTKRGYSGRATFFAYVPSRLCAALPSRKGEADSWDR